MQEDRWEDRAKCSKDPVVQDELKNKIDRFHDFRDSEQHIRAMEKYCAPCPVRQQCLERALELSKSPDLTLQAWGFWGGMSKKRRSFLLTKQKNQKNQAAADVQSMLERLTEQFPGNDNPIAS